MSSGFIVLGMHRSGTSLVSEIVHRWGAFGRPEECLPSDKWNARGYWELSQLVDFNTRLLHEVGATWTFPPGPKGNSRLSALALEPRYRTEAINLLASMKPEQNPAWFWKDPRLSILLPFWQQLWGDVSYIICVRDPFEICRSLADRDRLSFPVSVLLWQRYMLSILEGTRNAPTLVVSYSAVLRNTALECARLSNFLSSHSAASLPQSIGALRQVVDRELQHFTVNCPGLPLPLTKSQRKLQEVLETLAESGAVGSEVNLQRCSLPASWRTLLQANLLLLRCQRRWDRIFGNGGEPHTALPDHAALEAAHAFGRAILDIDSGVTHSAYNSDIFAKLMRPRLGDQRPRF